MKSIVTSIFLMFCPLMAMGEDLDSISVMRLASRFLGTDDCAIVKKAEAYCVVQRNNADGYVIVALHRNSERRILGYADNCSWRKGNMPEVLTEWLDGIRTSQNSRRVAGTSVKKSVSPLLTCHWHQHSPYNDLTPVITDGNVKTVAGCVAIAAAQIAYYWRKDNPDHTLRDSPTYPYGMAPVTMSIPKGSPNDWNLIKDSYTEEDTAESKHAVAQLCYVLGTTSYLNFASSTGGSIFDASNALYSQYNLLSNYIAKNNITQSEWEELIYTDICNGRPIMCAGNDDGGHAFVLDGYDSNLDLYHFNFGWGGSGDGYYPIDDSDNSMGGYSQDQSVVYNIHPKNRNIDASISVLQDAEDYTLDISIDITNKSTLDVKCLKLYVVPQGESIGEMNCPTWQHEASVACDAISRHIDADNIETDIAGECTVYLTDENNYILCENHINIASGIMRISVGAACTDRMYNMKGQGSGRYTKGVYITGKGKKIIR